MMIAFPIANQNGQEHSEITFAAPTRLEQQIRVLELTVQLLIARACLGESWEAGVHETATLLAAMPFTTAEYASARQHLKNAEQYCLEYEFGAATFEFRSLRGKIARL
jgi:hypothetical protein